MEIKELITEFSQTKPKADIIVGYGSGVKRQANDKGLSKQIDLIMGVEDAKKWHQENFEMNPGDYSKTGFKLLPIYQNLGTKINYLTYLPYEENMFKIGVISTSDLIDDLVNWRSFYLAGRFQKPIEVIKSNTELDKAIESNRLNALKTSLLLSEEPIIPEKELYRILCSLSFLGDWRQILHIENPNKINNIVNGSYEELHRLYGHSIESEMYRDFVFINHEQLLQNISTLPDDLLSKINSVNSQDLKKIRKIILNHFKAINIQSSAAQPVKGLLLNGVSKTKTYLEQKIEKSKTI